MPQLSRNWSILVSEFNRILIFSESNYDDLFQCYCFPRLFLFRLCKNNPLFSTISDCQIMTAYLGIIQFSPTYYLLLIQKFNTACWQIFFTSVHEFLFTVINMSGAYSRSFAFLFFVITSSFISGVSPLKPKNEVSFKLR